jgi:hypothetical protein
MERQGRKRRRDPGRRPDPRMTVAKTTKTGRVARADGGRHTREEASWGWRMVPYWMYGWNEMLIVESGQRKKSLPTVIISSRHAPEDLSLFKLTTSCYPPPGPFLPLLLTSVLVPDPSPIGPSYLTLPLDSGPPRRSSAASLVLPSLPRTTKTPTPTSKQTQTSPSSLHRALRDQNHQPCRLLHLRRLDKLEFPLPA